MKKTKVKTSKKAQIEVSFNWIFVLIAGAVILFFFLRVINSEMDSSQSTSNSRAVTNMNAVMTALQQNPDSISMQNRINYEITFECDISGHSYGVQGANTKQELPSQLIFSPKTIGDSRLIAWVRTFNAPYPISSVLYLTDEKTKYVFLNNDDGNEKIKRLYYTFPDNITKEYISIAQFSSQGDQGFRQYILIINENAVLESFSIPSTRLVSKIPYVMSISDNQITFYEFGSNNNLVMAKSIKQFYFTNEMLMGAIISGNPELYDCVINKALQQVRVVSDVIHNRTSLIHDAYPPGHDCRTYYSVITLNHIQNMSTFAKNKEYDELYKKYQDIESMNNMMHRSACVTLY